MAEKKIRNNKNGNLSIENFVRLIHTGEIDQWMRKHRISDDPCPPYSLIATDQMCAYCVSCTRYCMSQVKENKDSYTVKKVKYLKADLDKLKGE